MSTARLITGDVRAVLGTLPDASVDLVMTSPPFLSLRSYLAPDHPDKHLEIGSEPTPAAFIDTLLAVTADLRRVLAPHGSLVVELGDSYSESGGAGGDYSEGGFHDGQPKFRQARAKEGWPLGKSLACIPDLYQVALAYGINPLTGAESPAGKWRVRNKRAWVRPNPPVGGLGDKVRPATSYMVMACTSRERWFDLEAVRVPLKPHTAKYNGGTRPHYGERGGQGTVTEMAEGAKSNVNGAPPLDWVNVPTQPYAGAHYATWPEALCVQPILMQCPERVCRECGEPSRRIVERESTGQNTRTSRGMADDPRQVGAVVSSLVPEHSSVVTLGWTDCSHDAWRPGVVLDPFAGSGTVLQVATRLGRDAIGIDLDARNADLVRERVGLFLG